MDSSPARAPARVLSIDLLRGLVVLVMIVVNDFAFEPGIPAWAQHTPEDVDGLTFVDVVFPAFLLVAGLSIPLALERRRERGEGTARILWHVLTRGAALLVMGLMTVHDPDDAAIGWPHHLWAALMYVALILAFHAAPRAGRLAVASRTARIVGWVALVYLAYRFRDEDGGRIEPSYWGILGGIGWAYLVCAPLYLALRRLPRWTLVLPIAGLVALYPAAEAGLGDALVLPWGDVGLETVVPLADDLGTQPAIMMVGVLVGALLAPPARALAPRVASVWTAVIAAVLAVGGFLLEPAYGLSKDLATPAWALWSSALTLAVFIPLHLLLDVGDREPGRLARVLVLAGRNALLIYLLHPLLQEVVAGLHLHAYTSLGDEYPQDVVRAIVVACGLCGLGAWLLRRGVRLQV